MLAVFLRRIKKTVLLLILCTIRVTIPTSWGPVRLAFFLQVMECSEIVLLLLILVLLSASYTYVYLYIYEGNVKTKA